MCVGLKSDTKTDRLQQEEWTVYHVRVKAAVLYNGVYTTFFLVHNGLQAFLHVFLSREKARTCCDIEEGRGNAREEKQVDDLISC